MTKTFASFHCAILFYSNNIKIKKRNTEIKINVYFPFEYTPPQE